MWMAGALGEDKEVFDLLFGKNLGLLACHRMIQINAARILNQSSTMQRRSSLSKMNKLLNLYENLISSVDVGAHMAMSSICHESRDQCRQQFAIDMIESAKFQAIAV
jgi:hypothetical protein